MSSTQQRYPHEEIYNLQRNNLTTITRDTTYNGLTNAIFEYRTIYMGSPRQRGKSTFLRNLALDNGAILIVEDERFKKDALSHLPELEGSVYTLGELEMASFQTLVLLFKDINMVIVDGHTMRIGPVQQALIQGLPEEKDLNDFVLVLGI